MTVNIPEFWTIATLAAAAFQTVRFMLQKHLATTTLSAAGATFARFFYSAPLVVVLISIYLKVNNQSFPALSSAFWLYGVSGGLSQILATICVVMLFKSRNFAVGITFKKTEVLLTVLVGWIVLGEGVSSFGFIAILIGMVGVLFLSADPNVIGWRLRDMANRAVALGLTSGVLFGISGVSYRGASLEIASEDPVLRAGVTLACVVVMQMASMAVWLKLREKGQLDAVWRARKVAGWIGLTSMCGSMCWFLAYTLQTAAYVNALGQVELIFSIMATTLFFKEKISLREVTGMAILCVSILILILVI